MEEDNPKAQEYEVWDGLSLSSYIEKTYSIHLGIRQCQRLFHKLGFSPVRPQTYPNKGEDNKDIRESFKKIEELEKENEAIVVYQDEVHFQLTTSITCKWVPKGSKPQVKSAPGRKSIAYSGYVVPSTGELIVTKPSRFNYETVIQSFRDFIQSFPPQKRIFLVLDNTPWHKKAVRLVQSEALEEYQDIRDKLTLIFLPPYSPDLNPIEQCWRITCREVTHNTYFPDMSVLENTLDGYFVHFRKPNPKFASLCSFKELS